MNPRILVYTCFHSSEKVRRSCSPSIRFSGTTAPRWTSTTASPVPSLRTFSKATTAPSLPTGKRAREKLSPCRGTGVSQSLKVIWNYLFSLFVEYFLTFSILSYVPNWLYRFAFIPNPFMNVVTVFILRSLESIQIIRNTLGQWFPIGVPWESARGAVNFWI